ncbi:unnamed protein product [Bursaphelenchus okinawaensis]|uniref:Aminoacyl-transfer RNA synthetases class-II family profile domain-containing protein n=1 Tax=Bursaphelenchus okinawaensis TaxID=465554 RepID=A0A811JSU3_9BILA|nr:unnamed protein product [Bursaphelenchus okinawaensis]CAG9081431.1 unnamed protein product [Bursaphelenchus okinawaensis]
MLLRALQRRLSCRFYSQEAFDEKVLEGWVKKSIRTGKITFMHVYDGRANGTVQAVVPKEVGRNFKVGSAVRVKGRWVKSQGAQQSHELLASEVEKMAKDQDMVSRTELEDLRANPEARFTIPEFAAVLKTRSRLNHATHMFFEDTDYYLIDTPLLTLNECEGAGEVFNVVTDEDKQFFGERNVFLPVSAQLHLESLICGLPNVYTLGTAFRAEKCMSSKHLSEFRMLEAESAFVDNLDRLCDIVECYVRYIMEKSREWKSDFEQFKDGECLCDSDYSRPFPRITYNEAVDILTKKGNVLSQRLSKKNELELVEIMEGPLFVQRYPAEQKPFYMRVNDQNQAECFDLLAPVVGELAGGSIREYDKDALSKRLPKQDLEWYLNLRSNSYPRSGGFGLGMERFMQSLFGIHNIKDTVAFPRWYKHCKC